MKKINDLDPEDISMYYQIENYELSQKKIKQSINYYYEMKDKLELFLISDKWLNKWKEYSCINYYSSEEIKSQPYNWEKLRKQKRSKIKLDKFNNDDIIQFNNISRSSDFNSSFKPDSNFHLVTKECFNSFSEGLPDKEHQIIKFNFEAKVKKLIAQTDNKIIVLYFQNINKLKLILFILEYPVYENFYNDIRDLTMNDYLRVNDIDDNCESQTFEIKDGIITYPIYYINKSYNNEDKGTIFNNNLKYLIISLINFDNKKKIKEESIKEQKNYYLIDRFFFENLKARLNYDNIIINQNITNKEEEMINQYFKNIKENEKEMIMNEENKIIKYLEQKDGKIIKLYTDFYIIDNKIWNSLTKLFKYNIKISVDCYTYLDLIAIKYDDKNVEILNFKNNQYNNKILLSFFKEQNIENIIHEILKPNPDPYFYDFLNIIKFNQTHKILEDKNSKNNIGIAININEAINDKNFFRIIDKNEIGKEIKYNIGLNESLNYTNLKLKDFINNFQDMKSKMNKNILEFNKKKINNEKNPKTRRQNNNIPFNNANCFNKNNIQSRNNNLNNFNFKTDGMNKIKNNFNIININNFNSNQIEKKNNNNFINNNINFLQMNYQFFPVGLENVGATCYMNATLQCLSNCYELSLYLLDSNRYNNEYSKFKDNFPLTYAYANVVHNLFPSATNYKSYFRPIYFKETVGNLNELFKQFAANDSKDLLIYILEKINEELRVPVAKNNNLFQNINLGTEMGQYLMFMHQFYSQNTSIISNNFYGINESIVQCLNCGYSTFNFSIFNFIIFPLEEARKYSIKQGQMLLLNQRIKTFMQLLNNSKEGKITLKNCFEYNQKLDFLQGENSIFCNHCHKSSNANMCNKIIFTPKILCIVLNRGRGNIYQVKIDFPEILDLTIFVQSFAPNKRYELIGVITHLGQSGPGGHFIAICKSIVNGQWYTFNDQIVSPSSFSEALNTGVPYILFYHAIP